MTIRRNSIGLYLISNLLRGTISQKPKKHDRVKHTVNQGCKFTSNIIARRPSSQRISNNLALDQRQGAAQRVVNQQVMIDAQQVIHRG